MEYPWDDMIGFEKLGLYYEAHMAGLDGECFHYSIYLDGNVTEEKCKEICDAVYDFRKPYSDKEIYMGYLDIYISKEDDMIFIYLDLGNVDPDYEQTAIEGILKALNNVSGIKSVILNEDCECDIPDEYF